MGVVSEPVEIPAVESPRLILRGWRPEDLEPMTAINSDPEVARWLGSPDPAKTGERIRAWTEHWRRLGFGLWAVEETVSGQMVGRVGFVHQDDWTASEHDAEIGWTLASHVWGRGYATEAATAALNWARPREDLQRIISITLPTNLRSRRVMEKLGLSYEGEAHWHGFDQVWYALDLGEGEG